MGIDFLKKWDSIKRGEIAALRELFNETNQSLLNYSFRISRDQFIAEEAVQDVFVNIWNNRETLEIRGSVKSYLYQSVHNQTLNKIKQLASKRNSIGILVSDELWQYLEENSFIDEYIIEKLEAEETELIIRRAIDSLPEQCREVFLLSRDYHLANIEIAQKLNLSVSTVKTQIYRALDRIREEFYK